LRTAHSICAEIRLAWRAQARRDNLPSNLGLLQGVSKERLPRRGSALEHRCDTSEFGADA
jgi:hypothetical protein